MANHALQDSQGNWSSKRIAGAVMILAALAFNGLGLGDPETNRVIVWAGVTALGVGTLETRVQK